MSSKELPSAEGGSAAEEVWQSTHAGQECDTPRMDLEELRSPNRVV